MRSLRPSVRFCVMPMANKDGVAKGRTRFNLNGIDLNRGWDKPADEKLAPENAARPANISYKTHPKAMLGMDPARHGWERFGQDHCACWGPGRPSPSYMEGAWMTKVNGRYYLQYGAPGTEYNVYATGAYVAGAFLVWMAWDKVSIGVIASIETRISPSSLARCCSWK